MLDHRIIADYSIIKNGQKNKSDQVRSRMFGFLVGSDSESDVQILSRVGFGFLKSDVGVGVGLRFKIRLPVGSESDYA